MPALPKVTILLADEDALRREGLAAVLLETEHIEVIAGVADGETALNKIRALRPDVAVVDLNLPGVHGIELIRRIRTEALATKVVILAASTDDDTVREVVRAGGDGYLLKNGPARHLIDAISYIRDGGQYFSPQLKRDGRDRHLFEEPVREQPVALRPAGSSRRARSSGNFRDRIRESAEPGLGDRDYEIMSMMADGIRPILDRLEEIDGRVAEMEVGDAPVPTDARGWLTNQFADTLNDRRPGGDAVTLSRNVTEIEARLPELIEEAVTKRFHQMADKLQQNIEETHVKTLESFVKNIQVKLVRRVSALEQDMSKQAVAMSDLQAYSQRTEDNLGRLIRGVDQLAQELPKRLASAAAESRVEADRQTPPPPLPARKRRTERAGGRPKLFFWAAVAAVPIFALIIWGTVSFARKSAPLIADPTAVATPAKPKPPGADADTKTKMQAAQQFADREEYAAAEDLYKQVVKAEPRNSDAMKALASVLYREDKIDESTAVLDKILK